MTEQVHGNIYISLHDSYRDSLFASAYGLLVVSKDVTLIFEKKFN